MNTTYNYVPFLGYISELWKYISISCNLKSCNLQIMHHQEKLREVIKSMGGKTPVVLLHRVDEYVHFPTEENGECCVYKLILWAFSLIIAVAASVWCYTKIDIGNVWIFCLSLLIILAVYLPIIPCIRMSRNMQHIKLALKWAAFFPQWKLHM